MNQREIDKLRKQVKKNIYAYQDWQKLCERLLDIIEHDMPRL